MHIPGFGEFAKDEQLGWLVGPKVWAEVLGHDFQFVLEGYEEEEEKSEFHTAMERFLALKRDTLDKVSPHVFRYYQDCSGIWAPEAEEYVQIGSPEFVWEHVQLGDQVTVGRRCYGDKKVYLSMECECAWEPEHGLQIVLKEGAFVNKVGPFDGHLTNSDTYANPELENVVYRGASQETPPK